MPRRVGIDTGGTFTDLVAIDEDRQSLLIHKVSSTPLQPDVALQNALSSLGESAVDVERLVLGTTVATNAVITRRGARVALLTTGGFEDVLYIQRGNRQFNYDLRWRKPQPLVRRRHCLGVRERIDHRGTILIPLDEAECARLTTQLERLIAADGIEALAISLLYSYVNPEHEDRLACYLMRAFPHLPLSLSHEVAPVWREYERSNTTVVDAFVKPLIATSMNTAQQVFTDTLVGGVHSLMKSNGGAVLLREAEARPIDTLLSGLVGGVVAGGYFANLTDCRDAISLDMGGTSCDIGLIRAGQPHYMDEFALEWGSPVVLPVVDVTTIGAGGGSVIWRDRGGFLRVGPQSAGAQPGPASYDRGGTDPTVTDAQLVLGRLNPQYFLGGALELDPARAKDALDGVASALSLSRHEAAAAAIAIADDNMASAIRLTTLSRGTDPRSLSLIAFGGAGPLHACGIARNLGLRTVIIPVHPGLCSALGTLIAEVRVDVTQTVVTNSDEIAVDLLEARRDHLVRHVVEEMRRQGYEDSPEVSCALSIRYRGQNYEQDVPLPPSGDLASHLDRVFDAFHRLHEEHYGYKFPNETLEIVALRARATGRVPDVSLPSVPPADIPQPVAFRDVYMEADRAMRSCPVYRRDTLPAAVELAGPAVIEEMDSTIWLPPDAVAHTDSYGNVIIHLEDAA